MTKINNLCELGQKSIFYQHSFDI